MTPLSLGRVLLLSALRVQKMRTPQVSLERPVFEWMVLSRILSPSLARRVMIISLLPPARGGRPPAPAGAGAVRATITRRLPRRSGAGQAPGLLLCLAPQKVFRAPRIAARAVGSYPAFTPLPGACALGGLFSVTLSVAPGFRPSRPWILHGLLPGGVRTFLSRANRERSSAIRS